MEQGTGWAPVTHCQVDQAEQAVPDRLGRQLREAQAPHLAVPEVLGPILGELAGRIARGPRLGALLADGDPHISAQRYQLLHCRHAHARHQDVRYRLA